MNIGDVVFKYYTEAVKRHAKEPSVLIRLMREHACSRKYMEAYYADWYIDHPKQKEILNE